MPKLLLVGLGHAHLEFLKNFARWQHRSDWQIAALIPPANDNPAEMVYTGMITGILASDYSLAEASLNATNIAHSLGCRHHCGTIRGLNQHRLVLDDGSTLPFDFLSIAIGATTAPLKTMSGGPPQVLLRPIETLKQRLLASIIRLAEQLTAHGKPIDMTVVGGGWAGIEVALCLANGRLPLENFRPELKLRLITTPKNQEDQQQDPNHFRATRRALKAANIEQVVGRVESLTGGGVKLADGRSLPTDLVINATGPSPHATIGQLALPLTDKGFLATNRFLQVTGREHIFALGDTAGDWYAKKGVNALAQGRLLAKNIIRLSNQQTPLPFSTWRPRLQLINTGDRSAILHYGRLCFRSRLAWRLKDAIDRRYVNSLRTMDFQSVGSIPNATD